MVALVVGQCPTEVTTLDARNPRSGYPGRGFRRFGGVRVGAALSGSGIPRGRGLGGGSRSSVYQ
jgi:hypothetical protein